MHWRFEKSSREAGLQQRYVHLFLYLLCDNNTMTCLNLSNADDNWLNVVCYSLSTKSGTLAFAHQRKIIVLSNQWDTKLQQFKYSIVWSGELDDTTDDEITAIACLTVTTEQNEVNNCWKNWRTNGYIRINSFYFSRPPIIRASWLAYRRGICNSSTLEEPSFCLSNGMRNPFSEFYCKTKLGKPSKRFMWFISRACAFCRANN